MVNDDVILVNADDQVLGTMPKLQAHEEGKLHRAFSIFLFNSSGELLLQQRAFEKYHSGGKWTNTCCSHPRPGEITAEAAKRRLQEEMGMACEMQYVFSFQYQAEVGSGLIEHEYDHVYFSFSDQLPKPNPQEVHGYRYTSMKSLEIDLQENQNDYTEWLKIAFARVVFHYDEIKDFFL